MERPEGRIIPLYALDVHVGARRLGAAALDLLIVGIAQIWLGDVFGVTRLTSGSPLHTAAGYAYVRTATSLDLPWIILLAVVYFSVLEALFGATWGKWVAGLRVVDREGGRARPGAVLARNILRVVDAWPLAYGIGVIGAIAAVLSPRRQRLGDRVAHTLVVRSRTAPLAYTSRREVWRRVLALLAGVALLVLGCLGFSYYGRPPLVIQGLANTHALFLAGDDVASYALDSPRWGTGMVTYPIHYNRAGTRRICRGFVTLRWHGFFGLHGGWVLASAATTSRCR